MNLSRENMQKILLIILFFVITFGISQNISISIAGMLGSLFSLFLPFLIGACIAFILNVPLSFIESKLKLVFKQNKHPKLLRALSIVLTLIFIAGVIFAVFFMIIPQMGDTFRVIAERVPPFIKEATDWITLKAQTLPTYITDFIANLSFDWSSILDQVFQFLNRNISNFFGSTVDTATTIASFIVNAGIGFVFSIYILLQKETLSRQVKMLLFAYTPKKFADEVVQISRLTTSVFAKFISGQCLEAIILGVLFFISMSIFRFPYALLISVAIAFLSLIPIFGAFVGCAIGAFLILINQPSLVIWFIILFLVVQQIEGNLIYPYVVGGSVGLPSIWVLTAVTIGGSLFGVLGMLFFIPFSAVLYITLRRYTYDRLKKSKVVIPKK